MSCGMKTLEGQSTEWILVGGATRSGLGDPFRFRLELLCVITAVASAGFDLEASIGVSFWAGLPAGRRVNFNVSQVS